MACGCKKNADGQRANNYTVVLPGGKRKVYSSDLAANAMAAQTGGYVIPPGGDPLANELAQMVEAQCVGANCS